MIYIRKPKLADLKAEIVKAQAARASLTLNTENIELLGSLIEFYEQETEK